MTSDISGQPDVTTAGTFAPASSLLPASPPRPLVNLPDTVAGLSTASTSNTVLPDSTPQRPSTGTKVDHLDSEDHNDNKDVGPSFSPIQPTLTKLSSILHPPDESAPLSTGRLIVIGSLVTCTIALSAAGAMVLTIALPTIQTDLNMSESELQWVSSAFSLTNGCFLLLSGRLADVFGRKLVFMIGMLTYAVWTLIGGWMNNGIALIVTRALAGTGSAMGIPSAIGIIAANFQGRARSTAFASFSAGAPIGAAFGIVVGGVMTSYSSSTWRGCLWIFGALAFALAVPAWFLVPNTVHRPVDKRIDWIGALLATCGLILVQFAVSAGESAPNGWATSYIIVTIIIGPLLVAGFFFWERHVINNTSRPPLMRLKLWTRARGKMAAVYSIGFLTWMGFTALFFHATLFYQQVQGVGAIGAMLRFLPCPVSGVLCNVLVAALIATVPTQWIVCIGLLSTSLASVLFALCPADVSYWRLPFNGMWMGVLGADFLMATGSVFVSALALPEEQSVAGAVFQTLVQLGGSFGLAVTTVISDAYNKKSLAAGRSPIDSQLAGIHAAFWLGAGCGFAALVVALVMLRGMGTIGKEKKKQVRAEEVTEAEKANNEKTRDEKV